MSLPQFLRIAIIAPKFPITSHTNVYGLIWPILKTLSKQGHDITVFSWKSALGEAQITVENVRIHFIGDAAKSNNMKDFPRLVFEAFSREHTQNPFHIVHSLTDDAILIARRRKRFKVATIFDIQATHIEDVFTFIGMSTDTVSSRIRNGLRISYTFLKNYFNKDRNLLALADGFFVTSPQQQLVLERYYLYPQTRIFTVPYGMDIHDLSQREKSELLKKQLSIPQNCKVAVTISEMTEKSEMIHILRAFQKVTIKKPNSKLLILGTGPQYKAIEFEMLNLALASKVVFLGNVPPYEISDYIDLADVFISLSNRSINADTSTFEAMAQKKIVIGSEVSALSNIIENTKDGFLIRPADSYGLSELIIDIFSHSEHYEHIGENARSKVLSLFDLDKLVSQTLSAYIQVLRLTRRYDNHAAQPVKRPEMGL
ncbi:MAG: glycosyltransferase family 4 protein [Bdellovibrionaceae bacterium]|nr:glycosyltransferase family 4 protein [Pseudobdellovibrionaceae bacterium]